MKHAASRELYDGRQIVEQSRYWSYSSTRVVTAAAQRRGRDTGFRTSTGGAGGSGGKLFGTPGANGPA